MERTAPVLGEKKVVAALAAAGDSNVYSKGRNSHLQKHETATSTSRCTPYSPTKVIHYDTLYTVITGHMFHTGELITRYELLGLPRKPRTSTDLSIPTADKPETSDVRGSWDGLARERLGFSFTGGKTEYSWIMPVFIMFFRANATNHRISFKAAYFYLQLFILKNLLVR